MQLHEPGLKPHVPVPRLTRVRAELKEILGMLSTAPKSRAEARRRERKSEMETKELFD
jgi:hypothetical protein